MCTTNSKNSGKAVKKSLLKLVIVLNGPPGVGKDTIARAMTEMLGAPVKLEFKTQLFTELALWSGVPVHELIARNSDRSLKEVPWDKLKGLSVRQALIHVSEDIIKPRYGAGYFGTAAAARAEQVIEAGGVPVFSDGGFNVEIQALASAVGPDVPVLVVRMHRDGCSFDGDSRSYITLSHPSVHLVDANLVEGDVCDAVQQVASAVLALGSVS